MLYILLWFNRPKLKLITGPGAGSNSTCAGRSHESGGSFVSMLLCLLWVRTAWVAISQRHSKWTLIGRHYSPLGIEIYQGDNRERSFCGVKHGVHLSLSLSLSSLFRSAQFCATPRHATPRWADLPRTLRSLSTCTLYSYVSFSCDSHLVGTTGAEHTPTHTYIHLQCTRMWTKQRLVHRLPRKHIAEAHSELLACDSEVFLPPVFLRERESDSSFNLGPRRRCGRCRDQSSLSTVLDMSVSLCSSSSAFSLKEERASRMAPVQGLV